MIEKIKKIGVVISFILASLVSFAHADRIYLKDGSMIKGEVVGITTEEGITTYSIKTFLGEFSVEKDKINRIEYEEPLEEKEKEEEEKPAVPFGAPVKVEVEKPVQVKVERMYKHFLISYMRDFPSSKITNKTLDENLFILGGEKKGGANVFSFKYFIFPDVALGTEYVMGDIKVKGGYIGEDEEDWMDLVGVAQYMERAVSGNVQINTSFINIIGEKYIGMEGNMGSFLQAGLGFGTINVQATANPRVVTYKGTYETEDLGEFIIDTPLSGMNFFIRYGIGYMDSTIYLFLHLDYQTTITGEFEIVGFLKGTDSISDFKEIGFIYPEIKYGGFGWGFSVGIKF